MQKTVLVTGCSSGIGLESALDLTRQGFRVLAACRKAEDVARMQELGLTGILLDLDDPQSVERAAEKPWQRRCSAIMHRTENCR